MKQYKCIRICTTVEGTEELLNELAKENWKVVCSYAKKDEYLILERDN